MTINKVKVLDSYDFSSYARSTIKRFTGIGACEKRIVEIHSPKKNQYSNVRKQASQIRACVSAALDYFDAYKCVSLTTKPLLMYYCIMNLALAEILIKGSGESSLDLNRNQHNHHGLTFSLGGLRTFSNLDNALNLVRASPHQVGGSRKGTFHLWHQFSRDYPVIGKSQIVKPNGVIDRYEILAFSVDEIPKQISNSGLSLIDCLNVIPGIADHMVSIGESPMILKSKFNRTIHEKSVSLSVTLQPSNPDVLEKISEGFLFSASAQHGMTIKEIGGGCIINNTIYLDGLQGEEGIFVRQPSSIQSKKDEIFYFRPGFEINEFGIYYISMYMLSNIVRYYPDIWADSVSKYDDFAYVVDRLLEVVEDRILKLSASELSGFYLIE